MEESAAQPLPVRPETVTTTDLLSAQLRAAPHEVGTRTLTAGGVAIAHVSTDVARLNPISATSSVDMPALEMLAALAGHDPTGVLIVEHAHGRAAFGFKVERGRVTSARGSGPLEDLGSWASELYARFPERASTPPPDQVADPGPEWVELAREFVREHVLDALERTTSPGSRITLLRGDVSWLGAALPEDSGLGLQHLLLEQARRHDELPRMLETLGNLEQLALPMYEPGPLPPGGKPSPSGDEEDWGDAEPDPANARAWELARGVFHLCDGQRSLLELIEHGMLGRFRTLEAIILLAKSQSVIIVDSPVRPAPTRRPKVLSLPARATPEPRSDEDVASVHPRPEPRPASAMPSTGYMLKRPSTERVEPRKRRVRAHPKPTTPTRAMTTSARALQTRVPTRTKIELRDDVVTLGTASNNASGGQTLFDALEAEIAAIDADGKPETMPPTRAIPWQYFVLALFGSLLFAGGAAFSILLD